ncbi:MAG: CinA family protein [Candidatus Syntropharchaeia archaeon]
MIEKDIGDLLREKGLKIAIAESCTGGLVSHRITNAPGSSDYFLGSLVTYSNELKKNMLGVKDETIEKFGAVSSKCAMEMAKGVRERIGVDIGIAVTGIAGPGGGRPGKPVGLVYIALAWKNGVRVERYYFDGDREKNKERSADSALRMLYNLLLTWK